MWWFFCRGGRFLKIELCKVKPKAESEKQVHHEAPKKVQGCTSAYIGNLAWDVTEADLRKFFKKCKIDAIRFALDKDSGEFRGFGHIDFADDESLEAAVKFDQQLVCGRPLKIAYSVPKRNQRDRSTEQLDRTKQPKTCFTCNEPGHMSYNCPKKELV
jgi:nucleolin